MCLAMPVEVIECLEGDRALVDLGGIRKEISLALVDDVSAGDFVILHVGFAIGRLDPDEAARSLEMFRQMGI
ncbi:hydrogenase formation protein HypC [Ectothiorhodospira haloalkaliphila]|uniref:Hydrogenase formation protein HypC n=1 Tax=Ectothiorhodospira haloalkaliphila TaxID=421628 RepID=W8KT30_9GAMM|nr:MULTISPECIES: HypC/HybG/HupF family hydrogenase formation chaperone [Ectothiorhodospira]AHK78721.1 hydrogenase formation protein HypC [Ectothiorhodospira haloalkaliphila]MCG5493868.1 HypC/HybG/HupF family hydrogenase formation chaperone [Ectothiorhodospira variabilis]MCG5498082.1 HypC/HybG/HupF family hydrogenase formation chaperone [Ectothiorhodospira variabilis]MCG5503671.1 HypC/HybG/HupF family hydrogenase formation chaperone [Ectothiorhodospira variabilis]MCG5506827.1 HypC/HybG/HupF fam